MLEAGAGPPLICLHGLGGTKASFMTTVQRARAGRKPRDRDRPPRLRRLRASLIRRPFDAPWFAAVAVELLDALGPRAGRFAGNSMGGRIALELGMCHPERVERLVLLYRHRWRG